MDTAGVAAALGLEPWRLEGALKRKTVFHVRDFQPPYLVFKKDVSHVERGTAVFLGEGITAVRGFPKIRRAFYLEPMVEASFGREVAVEEKMNGYNVRAFSMDGRVLAVTRGGYVCPYTTSKLAPLLEEFLAGHDYVVCGEAVGTENPYAVHRYPEAGGFAFFVFDLREKATGRALPVRERNRLLEDYGIPAVRLFGIYPREVCAREVFAILEDLASEDREGVVLKDPEMTLPPIKYTTSRTNTSDLRYAFRFPYDYGRDFFFSRIIREGYQAVEMEEDDAALRERARRLGESILLPMVETIRRVRAGENAEEEHRVRVGSLEELEALLEHLRQMGVECVLGEVWEEGEDYVAEIRRQKFRSSDKIRANLGLER
ncbi:MAG: RNA ligase [Euryarchaeota archaeon]|nr:RNA ligase [Euryarchaeota archaeon]